MDEDVFNIGFCTTKKDTTALMQQVVRPRKSLGVVPETNCRNPCKAQARQLLSCGPIIKPQEHQNVAKHISQHCGTKRWSSFLIR